MHQHIRWILIDFINQMGWSLSRAAEEFNLTHNKLFKVTNGAYIDQRLYNKLLRKLVIISEIIERNFKQTF